MSFDLRSEIHTRIGNTQDESLRIVLLLMLGVLDEVGSKIDALRGDEETLRKAVLNGLAATHHDDHIWLREHREFSEANQALIDHARPLMAWVESQMAAEEEMRQHRKTAAQKIIEGAASQLGTIIATAACTWAAVHLLK